MRLRSAGDPGATTGSIMIIIVVTVMLMTTLIVSSSAIRYGLGGAPSPSSSSSSSVATTSATPGPSATTASASSSSTASPASSTSSASPLPPPVAPESSTYQSCVTDSGTVYCVEGNQTYFAQLSGSSGMGGWQATTSYPLDAGTCVAGSGYIYCVDGDDQGAASSSVYYAQLSSSGIGSWKETTSYPFPLDYGPSCVTSGGGIYCLGGNSTVPGTGGSDLVYYAPISSAGVGQWRQVGIYGYSGGVPVAVLNGPGPYVGLGSGPACVTSSGDAYCVGGALCYETIAGPGCVADRYSFYTVLGSGRGIQLPPGASADSPSAWANATIYPDLASLDSSYQDVDNLSCVSASGYIYCVGGGPEGGGVNATYFAPLSGSGIGSWTATTDYPVGIASASCVTDSGYIYCINGVATLGPAGTAVPTSYYAPLSGSGIGPWLPTSDF